MKQKYPEEANKLLDEHFPKGDKRRGEALVILAMAFLEGQMDKSLRNKIDKIISIKPEDFAGDLCDYMEERLLEIITKFAKGNVNMASLPAFWIGLEADITNFLNNNKLQINKK